MTVHSSAVALEAHADAFQRRFGASPSAVWFSPGRVNTMGAHLDYNGGPVMPCAIDRGTFVALRLRSDGVVRMASSSFETVLEWPLAALPTRREQRWSDYPLGVLQALLARAEAPPGFDILYGGDLAIGAGLSSSASVCVGTARAVAEAWGLTLSAEAVVETALLAERGFVGVRCGIMDPYAIAMARSGSLLWLDCRDRSWESVPLDLDAVSIAVADTQVRRELAQSAFNERVQQCASAFEVLRTLQPEATCLRDITRATYLRGKSMLEAPLALRAQHVVDEVERTFAARAALQRGDVSGFGAAMTAAHHSLRDLFEVSVPELDCLVDAACGVSGVHGSRLTGAGFGGCVVVLLQRGREDAVREACTQAFARRFQREPLIEIYRPSGGPVRWL